MFLIYLIILNSDSSNLSQFDKKKLFNSKLEKT